MNLTPDSQIGNFTIIRLLGTGGMSEVYLAKDNLDRQFAIKILAANLTRDPSFRRDSVRKPRSWLHCTIPILCNFIATSSWMTCIAW
jgi:serine/threonine protein kinase